MAGQIIHPRAQSERSLPFFQKRNLVEASVSMLGHTYRTMVPEGTSAEELIEKVAKENGGGVARVYYPEFKTWEIVAVKMGDQLLVKGDPKRVADADFSEFPDPASLKDLAVACSRRSEGGIHFSIGASGIPLAVTEEQGIVFPNAEELRIGRTTSNIALWMTSVNINPQTISDLARAYSGGVSVSEDALKKIAESHGGVRSDRLLLHDNILVLNKDTGEILTSSQHAMRMEPVMVHPEREYLPPLPEAPNAVLPFDGSIARPPYLSFRTFDGALVDHVRVQFAPLPDILPQRKAPEVQKAEIQAPAKELKLPELRFSLLAMEPSLPPEARSASYKEKTRAERSQSAPAMAAASGPSQELVKRYFLSPRKEPVHLEIPRAVLPAREAEEPAPEPRRKKRKDRLFSRPKRNLKVYRVNPSATVEKQLPKTRKKVGQLPARKKEKLTGRQKKTDAAEKPQVGKIGKKERRIPRIKIPSVRLPAIKIKLPKTRVAREIVGKIRDRIPRTRKAAAPKIPQITDKKAETKTAKKIRPSALLAKPGPKKLSRHFFHELIGLFQRKRRGRKLSTKKNRAE